MEKIESFSDDSENNENKNSVYLKKESLILHDFQIESIDKELPATFEELDEGNF